MFPIISMSTKLFNRKISKIKIVLLTNTRHNNSKLRPYMIMWPEILSWFRRVCTISFIFFYFSIFWDITLRNQTNCNWWWFYWDKNDKGYGWDMRYEVRWQNNVVHSKWNYIIKLLIFWWFFLLYYEWFLKRKKSILKS